MKKEEKKEFLFRHSLWHKILIIFRGALMHTHHRYLYLQEVTAKTDYVIKLACLIK